MTTTITPRLVDRQIDSYHGNHLKAELLSVSLTLWRKYIKIPIMIWKPPDGSVLRAPTSGRTFWTSDGVLRQSSTLCILTHTHTHKENTSEAPVETGEFDEECNRVLPRSFTASRNLLQTRNTKHKQGHQFSNAPRVGFRSSVRVSPSVTPRLEKSARLYQEKTPWTSKRKETRSKPSGKTRGEGGGINSWWSRVRISAAVKTQTKKNTGDLLCRSEVTSSRKHPRFLYNYVLARRSP